MASIEDVSKAVEVTAKYAWAIGVAIAFVLFIPKDAAEQIGILTIRKEYQGFLWIGLVISMALWLGAAFKYIEKITTKFYSARIKEKEKKLTKERNLEMYKLRLQSLHLEERTWIACCLYFNHQTMFAERGTASAASLVQKGILVPGEGSIFRLPYTIKDNVWQYLLENRSEFITDNEIANPQVQQNLSRFRNELHN
ncbi:super-infection exclusion protein B [Janthinobacterium aestuarii]